MNKDILLKNIKKITNKALICNSLEAFIGGFFISIPVLFLMKNIIYILFLMLCIIYMMIRMIYRIYMLRNCESIEIKENSVSYIADQRLRANYFGDIIAVILFFFIMTFFINLKESNLSTLLSIVMVYCFLYLIIAYFSILNNFMIFKVMTVLSATIQGVMALLLLITYVLNGVAYCFQQLAQQGVSIDTITIQMADVAQEIITTSYILEMYPIFTVMPMIISIALYSLYIFITPVYQLGKLKMAFQTVNILIVLISILSFFLAHYIGYYINTHKTLFVDLIYKELGEFENGKAYYNNFGAGNIKNLFYLAVLPYTFGILIVNIIMELRLKYADKKCEGILEELKENEKLTDNYITILRKKYYYYGGKKHNFDICLKVYSNERVFLKEY